MRKFKYLELVKFKSEYKVIWNAAQSMMTYYERITHLWIDLTQMDFRVIKTSS